MYFSYYFFRRLSRIRTKRENIRYNLWKEKITCYAKQSVNWKQSKNLFHQHIGEFISLHCSIEEINKEKHALDDTNATVNEALAKTDAEK